MNISDIYFIKDINNIIKFYQLEINNIYKLQNDLYNYKLNFRRNEYDDIFKNIDVNIDKKNFIILIDKNYFYNKKDFNKYFHNLCEIRKMKLFYIFMDILLKKYIILDFQNDNSLFKIFNNFIFNYIFDDFDIKTIKKNITYDYIFSYNLTNDELNKDILNINSILKCLSKNTNIIIKSKRLPNNFL